MDTFRSLSHIIVPPSLVQYELWDKGQLNRSHHGVLVALAELLYSANTLSVFQTNDLSLSSFFVRCPSPQSLISITIVMTKKLCMEESFRNFLTHATSLAHIKFIDVREELSGSASLVLLEDLPTGSLPNLISIDVPYNYVPCLAIGRNLQEIIVRLPEFGPQFIGRSSRERILTVLISLRNTLRKLNVPTSLYDTVTLAAAIPELNTLVLSGILNWEYDFIMDESVINL